MIEKIKTLPTGPGVYLMKGQNDKVLYVGKAINLKSRVRSYFQKNISIKTQALTQRIVDIDVILVDNEIEALLLERSLIRDHQPTYNILLRDDKEFPWLRIDIQNPWPRIRKVRKRKEDQAIYLGPYTHVGHLDSILRLTSSIFPFIQCSESEFRQASRPCNYFDIKRCLAPCCGKISSEDYKMMMSDAIDFLKGKTSKVLKNLKMKMKTAAEKELFEVAARYRDQMIALEKVTEKQTVISQSDHNVDYIAIIQKEEYSFVTILRIRNGILTGQDSHFIETTNIYSSNPLRDFLLLYYNERIAPSHIIVEKEPNEKALNQVLETSISKPSSETEKKLLETAQRNAHYELSEYLRTTYGRQAALEMIQQRLALSKYPESMVCIDVSNLQNQSIVASLVYFHDGKPDKSKYRVYHIQSLDNHHDDYQSIREVMTRYLKRSIEEETLPDLILIDGGKGQLQAALDACQYFSSQKIIVEIASIAKARSRTQQPERIYRPHQLHPIILKPGDSDFRVLTSLRDEAHRFAIQHHRKKRSQNTKRSLLDQVDGVGPVLKKKLFEKFTTIEDMQHASIDAFTQIPGISEKVALNIQAILHAEDLKKKE
ncbi:MAG: excinuclease ABC subunit UvrC [Oligoflexales bacterium]